MMVARVFCVLVLLLVGSPVAFALVPGDAVRVVDGDTLIWHGQRLRLFGIDAPESGQSCDMNGKSWACGAWSARMLAQAVADGPVTCAARDIDRHGRTVAICHAGQTDLAQAQVMAGAAVAYARYSSRYLAEEARAKAARHGIWAGRMVMPEAHRAASRAPEPGQAGRCRIKGNIGATGRIYHQPGQRDYTATRIDPAAGEVWFCTSAEAEAAGFRAARR